MIGEKKEPEHRVQKQKPDMLGARKKLSRFQCQKQEQVVDKPLSRTVEGGSRGPGRRPEPESGR